MVVVNRAHWSLSVSKG